MRDIAPSLTGDFCVRGIRIRVAGVGVRRAAEDKLAGLHFLPSYRWTNARGRVRPPVRICWLIRLIKVPNHSPAPKFFQPSRRPRT